MKIKRFLLVPAYILCIVMLGCILFGCTAPKEEPTEAEGTFEIVGVKEELHVKIGTPAETLLEGVTVQLSNGEIVAPTLELGNADLSKAGEYEIAYSYSGKSVKSKLFVYGDIQLFYNGQAISTDTVEIKYSEAKNFLSAVEARDSFGNVLDLSLASESESFVNLLGDYSLTYVAQDRVGQILEKSVICRVSDTGLSADEKLTIVQEIVKQRISNNKDHSSWGLVADGFEDTAFTYAYNYKI